MSFVVQQSDLDIIDQSTRNLRIQAELLNHNFQTVDVLEGNIIQDDYSIDADSDVRRTYKVTFAIDDSTFQVGRDKKIWLDKYLRISVGIFGIREQDYRYYPIGIFVLDTADYSYDAATNSLSLSCLDLTAKLNGIRGGGLSGNSVSIPQKTEDLQGNEVVNTMRGAMISAITELGGIRKFRVEDMKGTILTDEKFEETGMIPYDLEFGLGATVWDIVKEIRDLYPGWETFFDEDRFICQPIPSYQNTPIMLDAETMAKYVISENTSVGFGAIKNVTEVWGKCLDADYYTDKFALTDDKILLTYGTLDELTGGLMLGFKADKDVPAGAKIKVDDFTEYPLIGEDNEPIEAVRIKAGTAYVVKFVSNGALSGFYFMGEYQIVAITKLVSKEPRWDEILYDLEHEPTRNISYTINPASPFCSDFPDVGEIRQVLSDGDYENIDSESLALQRAEYENWKTTDLLDSITLSMVDIPWLDVNQRVEYYSNNLGKKEIYLVKSKQGSSTGGTMTVNLVKFQPFYPWVRKK